jgi:ribose transport system substrate-binding protein
MDYHARTPMKKLSFVISLTNDENDYQQEQAAVAEKTARRLGVDLKIVHANNDAVAQSQQLLQFIQGSSARPDAIIFEPAGGTAFPQVARAAAVAGIGWVVLNHEPDYLGQLRLAYDTPMFCISSNHQQIGEIQGKQFAALLPKGGSVLYLEGPANSSAAKERTAAMMRAKPANIRVKSIRGNWTEESAYRAVSSWLRLSTSQAMQIDLVGAQDDSMAAGARKAFSEAHEGDKLRWLKLPFTGCDGMPKSGQAWVRTGLLAATIHIPPNTDIALEMLTEAIRSGAALNERRIISAESIPSLDELSRQAAKREGEQHKSAHA